MSTLNTFTLHFVFVTDTFTARSRYFSSSLGDDSRNEAHGPHEDLVACEAAEAKSNSNSQTTRIITKQNKSLLGIERKGRKTSTARNNNVRVETKVATGEPAEYAGQLPGQSPNSKAN